MRRRLALLVMLAALTGCASQAAAPDDAPGAASSTASVPSSSPSPSATVPGEPSGLSASLNGSAIDVSWAAPADAVDSYQLSIDGGTPLVVGGTESSATVPLPDDAGEQVTVEVSAVNAAGAGRSASTVIEALRTIRGTFALRDNFMGILSGIMLGDPNAEVDATWTDREFNRADAIEAGMKAGKKYDCSLGAGGGYDDIVPGAPVTVRDAADKVIATAKLRGGALTKRGCLFTYKVQVPVGDFYSIEVSHRGAITYSAEDLAKDDWKTFQSLGS